MMNEQNVDTGEIAKFNAIAAQWWDPHGSFKPLHDINPLRLKFIEDHVLLSGKKVLDVGCGGGILAESMSARGAIVTGIDAADDALQAGRQHAAASGLSIDYRRITVEELVQEQTAGFDVITCMEMLEHVPDPQSVIDACARLCKPGGKLFFSTLNRNLKSYLLAILGAEYVLQLIPKGTHRYSEFIKPSELGVWLRKAGLTLMELRGITYNPLLRRYSLTQDVDVNYLAYAVIE